MGGLHADKYVGCYIFVDSMSTFIHVEHQLGFSGSDTIRAKQNFEKLALYLGELVESYKTDNSVFKSNTCLSHVRENNQKLSYCGFNTHHKNGASERATRTVSKCARAQLLHAAIHWKD